MARESTRVLLAILAALALVGLIFTAVVLLTRSEEPVAEPDASSHPAAAAEPSKAASSPDAPPAAAPTADASSTLDASPTPESASTAEPMDVDGIADGDLSTVQGAWVTANGQRVTILGNDISWFESGSSLAEIENLSLAPATLQKWSDDDPNLRSRIEAASHGQTAELSWFVDARGFGHGFSLTFIPAGATELGRHADHLKVDADNDRLVALPGNDIGRMFPAELAEYTARRATPSAGTSRAESAKPTTQTDVPRGVHPAAGGPAPSNARAPKRTLDQYGSSLAAIVTPSGNIGCDIRISLDPQGDEIGNYVSCNADSWAENPPVPPANEPGPAGGYPIVSLGEGPDIPVYGGEKNDGFCYTEHYCAAGFGGEVMHYGDVIQHGNFVCASERNGLTCWNTKTGHGMLMSRSQFISF